MMRFSWVLVAFAAAAFALAGCGSYAGPPHVMCEVKGKVTYHGAPVDRVTMTFVPVEPGKGREDSCTVNKGAYTNKVIAGRYKITFEPAQGGTRLPRQFASAGTTRIEMDATKDGETNFDLK